MKLPISQITFTINSKSSGRSEFTVRPILITHILIIIGNNKTLIRIGRLGPNGEEETSSVQTVEKFYASSGKYFFCLSAINYLIDDARHAAKKLIATKISKGYQYLEGARPINASEDISGARSPMSEIRADESLKRAPPAELFSEDIIIKQVKLDPLRNSPAKGQIEEEKSFGYQEESSSIFRLPTECKLDLSDVSLEKKTKILQKALEMEVGCTFEGTSVILKGQQDELKLLKGFIKQLQNETNPGAPVSIRINPKLARQGSEIEKYGLGLGLICEVRKEKIMVLGEEDKVEAFKAYIVAKEAEVESPKRPSEAKPSAKNPEDEFIQRELDLTWNMRHQKHVIENRLRQSGLFYEFRDTKIFLLGRRNTIQEIANYLHVLDQTAPQPPGLFSRPSPFNNNNQFVPFFNHSYNNNNYSQHNPTYNAYNNGMFNRQDATEHKVFGIDKSLMEDIQKKGEELGVVATYGDNDVTIFIPSGQRVNQTFVDYINAKKVAKIQESLLGPARTQEEVAPSNPINPSKTDDNDDFEQKEIFLTPAHKSHVTTIQFKAKELDLICDFDNNKVIVAGTHNNIERFKIALQQLEGQSKKELYPKYWNFYETRPFAKIKLFKGTPEYEEVAGRFLESLEDEVYITRIWRVQNAQLMEMHVDNIHRRMQNKLYDPYHRRLLFQSSNDTGVDPYNTDFYATNSYCPRGIYLSRDASEIADDGEQEDGYYKMYLCDVYVGKVTPDQGYGSHLPFGCDTVKSGDAYIIYDRMQSYPMYEIDYRMADDEIDEDEDDYYDEHY